MTDVIIVGAGPTGLMAACELALAGASCTVVEQRAHASNITRAFGLHARALELLDARGLADQLVTQGNALRTVHPAYASTVDFGRLETRYPMLLIVPQSGTEQLLHERAVGLGVEIRRGAKVTGLAQDNTSVRLRLADGTDLEASYVIGADGAHSTIRDLLGVGFVGQSYDLPMLLADVLLPDGVEPPITQVSAEGAVVVLPFGDGWFRVGAWLLRTPEGDPEFAQIRSAFQRIAGTDYGMSEPRWFSQFGAQRRQARTYRSGRVFLAGDAAHVNSPIGGQGMNTGVQDAFNLGWKLAAVVGGRAPSGLLDSYQAERHPVGAAVLATTDHLTRLVLTGSRTRLAINRAIMAALLHTGPGRRRILGTLSGLAFAYPSGDRDAHPLTGQRATDLATDRGRLYEVLRSGRFVLLTDASVADAVGVDDRLSDRVEIARPLRQGGPDAVLVRPDGYIAWAGERGGIGDALMRWCGQTRTTRPGDRPDHAGA